MKEEERGEYQFQLGGSMTEGASSCKKEETEGGGTRRGCMAHVLGSIPRMGGAHVVAFLSKYKTQLQNATRAAVGILITTTLAFVLNDQLKSSCSSAWCPEIYTGLMWSAITVVMVSSPLIGKTTKIALERSIGTISGELAS